MGNAESLDLPDNSFECVMSIGVLHHTPGTQESIHELFRVLKPGGTAVIALYRLLSPKVFAAHAIRGVARGIEVVLRQDRCLYRWCSRLGSDHCLGTMLLECLGVPILKSYTRRQIRSMFSCFDSMRAYPIGMGLPLGVVRAIDGGRNPLGALWLIEATKASKRSESEY